MGGETDIFRAATRAEFDLAVDWAAKEGWNPGLDDREIFWESDPEGFVCVEREGEVIATGSIVSYGGAFGFMGFFIVREDLRGQGIGRRFWHWRKRQLQSRLQPGASIGMDGVFDMQRFYASGGFAFSHRNLRMEGIGQTRAVKPGIVDLSRITFELVSEYDRRCFGFARDLFLRKWIAMKQAKACGAYDDSNLKGFGVIRKCLSGYKIGPLFADSAEIGEALFSALANEAIGEPLILDTPENNPAAIDLAKRHGMKEVFGCARMYCGSAPNLPWDRIFGVTTFELG